MGCRITPLTVLFVLSGFIMLVSHRYFLVDTPSRVIVAPRRAAPHMRQMGIRRTAVTSDDDSSLSTLDLNHENGPGALVARTALANLGRNP